MSSEQSALASSLFDTISVLTNERTALTNERTELAGELERAELRIKKLALAKYSHKTEKLTRDEALTREKSMPKPSEANRAVARYVAGTFGGGKPSVTRFYDEGRKNHVHILKAPDSPQSGVDSYSTVGLSDCPLYLDGKEYEVRVEFVGVSRADFGFGNVLSTLAFCVSKTKLFAAPGVIFPDVLTSYADSSEMRHVMFVPPFFWPNLKTLELPDKKVAWLLAVPISDAEMELAGREGALTLEKLLEAKEIDMFDVFRKSVL